MNDPNKGEPEPYQDPLQDNAAPPSGLGVYDRPQRTGLTLPAIIALLILVLITAFIIWQL
jgi:hypothetical protein